MDKDHLLETNHPINNAVTIFSDSLSPPGTVGISSCIRGPHTKSSRTSLVLTTDSYGTDNPWGVGSWAPSPNTQKALQRSYSYAPSGWQSTLRPRVSIYTPLNSFFRNLQAWPLIQHREEHSIIKLNTASYLASSHQFPPGSHRHSDDSLVPLSLFPTAVRSGKQCHCLCSPPVTWAGNKSPSYFTSRPRWPSCWNRPPSPSRT